MLPASSEAAWRERWEAERSSSAPTARPVSSSQPDVRWHPTSTGSSCAFPKALEHLANRPGGRYRLSCRSSSPTAVRSAAQAESGAVRYDVFFDPASTAVSRRSWSFSTAPRPDMEHLRSARDRSHLNHGTSPSGSSTLGNPMEPGERAVELTGLKASTRDANPTGHLVCSPCAHTWRRAVVIEDLDFVAWREEGGRIRAPSSRASAPRLPRSSPGSRQASFRDRLSRWRRTRCGVIGSIPPTPRAGAPSTWLEQPRADLARASGHHGGPRHRTTRTRTSGTTTGKV